MSKRKADNEDDVTVELPTTPKRSKYTKTPEPTKIVHTDAELSELIHLGPEEPEPPRGAETTAPKISFLGSLFTSKATEVVTEAVILNPLGDVTVSIRDQNFNPTSGDTNPSHWPRVRHIKCESPKIRKISHSSRCQHLFREMGTLNSQLLQIPDDVDEWEKKPVNSREVLRLAKCCLQFGITGPQISKVITKKREENEDKDVKESKCVMTAARKELVEAPSVVGWSGKGVSESLLKAWAFGKLSKVERIVRFLIGWSFLTDNGELALPTVYKKRKHLGYTFTENASEESDIIRGCFPSAVHEYILRNREKYIQALLEIVYKRFNELIDPSHSECYHGSNRQEAACVDRMCGAFVRAVCMLGLPLEPGAIPSTPGHLSVLRLRDALVKMDSKTRHIPLKYRASESEDSSSRDDPDEDSWSGLISSDSGSSGDNDASDERLLSNHTPVNVHGTEDVSLGVSAPPEDKLPSAQGSPAPLDLEVSKEDAPKDTRNSNDDAPTAQDSPCSPAPLDTGASRRDNMPKALLEIGKGEPGIHDTPRSPTSGSEASDEDSADDPYRYGDYDYEPSINDSSTDDEDFKDFEWKKELAVALEGMGELPEHFVRFLENRVGDTNPGKVERT